MIIENTSFPFAEDYNKFVPVTCDLLRLTITIIIKIMNNTIVSSLKN